MNPRAPASAECGELESLLTADPAAAVRELRPLANGGDPQAQLLLGQLLINGLGTGYDPQGALACFRAAARARVPLAMNMVGRCYEYGLGTEVDYTQAAEWYFRAATFECDWAIYNYAHMLANGRGVKKDRAAAFAWFRLAAARGHARAMHFLGQYYENGWETPADCMTACTWYQRSAEGGDYRGQCSYASILTEQGHIDEALHWLRLAATTATPAYLAALANSLDRSQHQPLRDFAAHLRRTHNPIAPDVPALVGE